MGGRTAIHIPKKKFLGGPVYHTVPSYRSSSSSSPPPPPVSGRPTARVPLVNLPYQRQKMWQSDNHNIMSQASCMSLSRHLK